MDIQEGGVAASAQLVDPIWMRSDIKLPFWKTFWASRNGINNWEDLPFSAEDPWNIQ